MLRLGGTRAGRDVRMKKSIKVQSFKSPKLQFNLPVLISRLQKVPDKSQENTLRIHYGDHPSIVVDNKPPDDLLFFFPLQFRRIYAV